jgi:hypothetical protein
VRRANLDQGEAIIDIKYRRPRKGGGLDWEAAYHLDGAQDLASLRNGDVGSVLNADSYNAFAACRQRSCRSSGRC